MTELAPVLRSFNFKVSGAVVCSETCQREEGVKPCLCLCPLSWVSNLGFSPGHWVTLDNPISPELAVGFQAVFGIIAQAGMNVLGEFRFRAESAQGSKTTGGQVLLSAMPAALSGAHHWRRAGRAG